MKNFNYIKHRHIVLSLLLALFFLTYCNNPKKITEDCPYTEYIVYYIKGNMPWTVTRIIPYSPDLLIKCSTGSLVETDIEKVHSLYAYFDSLSRSDQAVSIDEKFSFVTPEWRYLDTDFAIVFISENVQDTLALSGQHYGGMTFHQRYFVDSIGHFKVFNIIKERDSIWAEKFNRLYVNGHYLLTYTYYPVYDKL